MIQGCYLEKLFVDTDRIGRGVGRVLFSWALDAARGLGAHELIIEADPDAAKSRFINRWDVSLRAKRNRDRFLIDTYPVLYTVYSGFMSAQTPTAVIKQNHADGG